MIEDESGGPGPTGNIFLIGLMGAGKTSVGRALARRLDKEFIDCDQEIERVTGVKISVIFEIEGEAGFRTRETKMLMQLVERNNIVLATGGGAVIAPENRRALAAHGTVVYLRASVADLCKRTRLDRDRPLLQRTDPKAKLEELYVLRDPLYREIAHVIVDTGNQSVANLAHKLELKLKALAPGQAQLRA